MRSLRALGLKNSLFTRKCYKPFIEYFQLKLSYNYIWAFKKEGNGKKAKSGFQ